MAVNPIAGDCLCLIARRYGLTDCRDLENTNPAALWNRALRLTDNITVPDERASSTISVARRTIVHTTARQAIAVRFVRPTAPPTAPALGDAIARLAISRYPTRFTSYDYNTNAVEWADHTVVDYNANANDDPACFCVEVMDPNTAAANVAVRLEALRPNNGGFARFPVNLRAARTLSVTATRMARDAARHRSCYLRLVADEFDQALRPQQTLLVTDMTDDGDPALEIIDQHVFARYEYPQCPRAAGSRCLLASAEADLDRGDSVELRVFVLRSKANGLAANDETGCVVTFDDVRRRINKYVRRLWAQDAITFDIERIEAIDPPSEILTVGHTEESNYTPDTTRATNADPVNDMGKAVAADGQISFAFSVTAFFWRDFFKSTGGVVTMPLTGGHTPLQTAQAIAATINDFHIDGLTATAVANRPPALAANARPSADVVPVCTWGRLVFTEITWEAYQDADQKIRVQRFDPMRVVVDPQATRAHIGSAMQRMLLRRAAAATSPNAINIFIAGGLNASVQAHTINSAAYLPVGCRPETAMENCITIPASCIAGDAKPATLAHEIGHALMDHANHPDDIDTSGGALMTPSTTDDFSNCADTRNNYATKRIGTVNWGWLYLLDSTAGAHLLGWQQPPPNGVIGVVANHQYAMSARIRQFNRITRTQR